jgi:hypothetical protein
LSVEIENCLKPHPSVQVPFKKIKEKKRSKTSEDLPQDFRNKLQKAVTNCEKSQTPKRTASPI